ncbi:MAG TPA: hypothetical protein VKV17_12525 [Bryobacteraceae bacterium]|nr:hypothetical protein [Bryobacteraceae bacterium]
MKQRNKWLVGAAALACAAVTWAQPPAGRGGRGGRGGPPPTPKAAAPIDITGYWVSVVTEDWRYRMVTAPKGKFGGVPLNPEGRRVANAWDPAKDEAAGQQCRAYGAAALMREPGRFHIAWQDDRTLRVDADTGKQTRLFHFGAQPPPEIEPSWQGYSVAEWEPAVAGRGPSKGGDLKVVTTHLLAGYLRKNGIPYSANAVVTEYYDLIHAPNGDQWLVVSTEVNDPQYLTMPFITSTHFKKLPDASGWDPEPCSAQ